MASNTKMGIHKVYYSKGRKWFIWHIIQHDPPKRGKSHPSSDVPEGGRYTRITEGERTLAVRVPFFSLSVNVALGQTPLHDRGLRLQDRLRRTDRDDHRLPPVLEDDARDDDRSPAVLANQLAYHRGLPLALVDLVGAARQDATPRLVAQVHGGDVGLDALDELLEARRSEEVVRGCLVEVILQIAHGDDGPFRDVEDLAGHGTVDLDGQSRVFEGVHRFPSFDVVRPR